MHIDVKQWFCGLLLLLILTSLAQTPPPGTAQGVSVGQPPEELADTIVIFVPSKTTPINSNVDIVYEGEVVRVERGSKPAAIVRRTQTLMRSVEAGVPVRMYLIKSPEGDAHYPIYVTNFVAAAPAIDIGIARANAGETFRALANQSLQFTLSVAFTEDAYRKADVYFGVMSPGQAWVATWSMEAGKPVLTKGMQPLVRSTPLAVAAPLALGGDAPVFDYRFTGSEPAGLYLVFALLVEAGRPAGDDTAWLAIDTKPLFFQR